MQGAGRAVVFGASGGIGAALVAGLSNAGWDVVAGSRGGALVPGAKDAFAFDLLDEESIVIAADAMRDTSPELVIVATGVLTLPDGRGPEKSYRQIDADALAQAFALNAIGPALIAKHFLPLLPQTRRAVFAALGARVGSVGDNRLGGWHGYRAGKAALAMLIRNFAIEMERTHPDAIVVGLHPGTVATGLSAPFRTRESDPGILDPGKSARSLPEVISRLAPADSGSVFDWRGDIVPP